MAERRYEFRVTGRLSERVRAAFSGMEVREVPAETVIEGEVADDSGVHDVLALMQSLGLEVVSVRRASGIPHAEESASPPGGEPTS